MTTPRIPLRDLTGSPLRLALLALTGLAAALLPALAPIADILPRPDVAFSVAEGVYGLSTETEDAVCALTVAERTGAWTAHHERVTLSAEAGAEFRYPPGSTIGYAIVSCASTTNVPVLPTAFVRNGDRGWAPVRHVAGWTMRAALLGTLILTAGASLVAWGPRGRRATLSEGLLACWAAGATLMGGVAAGCWIAVDALPAMILAPGLADGLPPLDALLVGAAALPVALWLFAAGLPAALLVTTLRAFGPRRT